MSNFIHVTPFMHVDNLDRETVGFGILQQTGDDAAPSGTSMFATSISSMQNSSPSLIGCLKAMFTGRWPELRAT